MKIWGPSQPFGHRDSEGAFLPEFESGMWRLIIFNCHVYPEFMCSGTLHCSLSPALLFPPQSNQYLRPPAPHPHFPVKSLCGQLLLNITGSGSTCFFLWVLVSLFLWGLWVTACRKENLCFSGAVNKVLELNFVQLLPIAAIQAHYFLSPRTCWKEYTRVQQWECLIFPDTELWFPSKLPISQHYFI